MARPGNRRPPLGNGTSSCMNETSVMWQRDQDRDADLSRTRIGLGEPADSGGEAAPGAVVQAFGWAAGLPGGVVQDFTQQAMSVANLRHPHVVQILDAGLLDRKSTRLN